MRKLLWFILSIALIPLNYTSAFAMADTAKSACVINSVTREVVYSKNMDEVRPMASTTKIMTAIIALERSSMEDVVTVSENAANAEGSAAYIEKDMKLYMRDLLYGLMLSSGNDAAVAIAEHISGDVQGFVQLMNEKAREIGAKNTNFTNPNGLPDGTHYTTAHDLALIACYAMENEDFREIVATRTYTAIPLYVPPKPEEKAASQASAAKPPSSTPEPTEPSAPNLTFYNHNKLLNTYEGATGIKTGYTDAAGRCLVSSAKRDGMEFIAVTLDDNNDWEDHAQMLDKAFGSHRPKTVIEKGSVIKVAKVDGKEYNIVAADSFSVPVKNNGGCNLELITHMASNIISPINKDEKVGYIEVRAKNRAIGRVDIVSNSDIPHVSSMRFRESFMSHFFATVKKILI